MENLLEGGKAVEVWPVRIKTNIARQTTVKEVRFCFF